MKRTMLYLTIAVIALACVVIAVWVGAFPITPSQILRLLTSPATAAEDPEMAVVLWQIRLPRIAAALLIGAGLSAAGAAYQGMFRNPLVSPDILGVSAGAGLGACAAIWLGLPVMAIQAMAFGGGLLAVTLANLIASLARRHDPVLTLVLVGIALGALCGSTISLIKIVADPYSQLPTISIWLLGGLSAITPQDLIRASVGIISGTVPLLLLRWRINLLSLPDEEAQALGINVAQMRRIFILCATLVTASAVSVAGIIGWVGLVVPHICRLVVGANYQRLLPASLIVGGLFVLGTDTLARSLTAIELPLGILTAFIGAPFFVALLLQRERQ